MLLASLRSVVALTLLSFTMVGKYSTPALSQHSLLGLEWVYLKALCWLTVLMNDYHWEKGCAC